MINKQKAMTNKDLIKEVESQITELARTGGRSHKMCVPPEITDTDMILSEMVRRFKDNLKYISYCERDTEIPIPSESLLSSYKELRRVTGHGLMDCKLALRKCGNDLHEAKVYLNQKFNGENPFILTNKSKDE